MTANDSLNEPRLRLMQLRIGYPGSRRRRSAAIVCPDELVVKPGQMICLLGPNGTGKTTLLRTLAGLLPALAGTIFLDGKPLLTLDRVERARRLGVLLTERVDGTPLTVEELVALGRWPHTAWTGQLNDQDKQQLAQALRQFELATLGGCPLTEISDGQRQRAQLARVWCQDCPINLWDEPTAYLDFDQTEQVFALARDWTTNQQRSMVIATHEIDCALAWADELWLLSRDGRLLAGATDLMLASGQLAATFPALSRRVARQQRIGIPNPTATSYNADESDSHPTGPS